MHNSFFMIKYKLVNDMNYKEIDFKKKFGQNFLIDNNIIEKIVKESTISDNSLVIEIGVGSANLTKCLCQHASFVVGYEIDKSLEKCINKNLRAYNNYQIIFDDFLQRDINKDIEQHNYKNIYIIANVPYYITTPIIEHIIESNLKTTNIVLMVQKEVGDRFSAKANTKEYSSITVFLNYFYTIKKLFIVNRCCFIPKPNVDSIIIKLESKERIKVVNEKLFFKLVRDSFRYKRKTIRNNLKEYSLEKIEKVLKEYGYDLNIRSEALDVKIFCDIANELSI